MLWRPHWYPEFAAFQIKVTEEVLWLWACPTASVKVNGKAVLQQRMPKDVGHFECAAVWLDQMRRVGNHNLFASLVILHPPPHLRISSNLSIVSFYVNDGKSVAVGNQYAFA
eukprot:TRINITY_DN15964_c0_g1_i3.p3 TRINITY_DN15964_c0_g1~~TRINITY_DN15964_c0_g1_i3.p3  ORF type:complete len:112 (-),score=7.42 TRINITY_DN15964_c0_g1_i3:287-622(-)